MAASLASFDALTCPGSVSCVLRRIDMSRLAGEKTTHGVDDDDESMLMAGTEPLIVRTGDLRLTVRWEQRSGHSNPGESLLSYSTCTTVVFATQEFSSQEVQTAALAQ
jgi:hypothetical protein